MRNLLVLLPLILLVREGLTQKGNCTASSDVLEVNLKYDKVSNVSADWQLPEDVAEDCVSYYSVCLSLVEEPAEAPCENITGTYWNITSLQSCFNYSLDVVALGENDTDLANGSITFFTGTPPGKVDSLTAVNQTCGSIFVEWSESLVDTQCVSNYTLCWEGASDGGQTCETISYPNTQQEITSLRPDTAYNITVAALGAGGEMSEPSMVQVNTRSMPQVEDLTFVNMTTTSVYVSWRNPEENSCAVRTLVTWCPDEPGSTPASSCAPNGRNSDNVPPDTTGFQVPGLLEPCTNFTISVRMGGAGGALSPASNIATHTDYESPAEVKEMSIVSDNSSTTISWTVPEQSRACKAGYYVCWEEDGVASSQVCDHSTAESYRLNLTFCKVYTASVRTIVIDGSMSTAANTTLDLATPGDITNLTVSSQSADTVKITWVPPLTNSECVENYTVYFISGPDNSTFCTVISGDSNEYSMHGLHPNSQYNVSLIALGPQGLESSPIVVHATTSESPGRNGGTASVGSLHYWSGVLTCIVLFLLAH